MEDQKSKRIFQKAKKPNGFEENRMDAKKPDNEDDNDDDNDKEDDLLEKEKKEKESELQTRFIECLNSFNTNAISECISYLDDLPYEVIDSVLAKTSRIKNPNWAYAKSILDDYVKRNIDSLEKIKADQLTVKNKDAPSEDCKAIDTREQTEEEYIEEMKKRRKI